METLQAIDISKYQGKPSRSWWRELKADGWELAIVGSWHGLSANEHVAINLANARAAGLKIATYVALNNRPGDAAVRMAKSLIGGVLWDSLSFVAIDCEVDGITNSIIEDAIQEVGKLKQRPIIYTAHWWWVGHYGDEQGFSHIPLWNAFYDQDPDIDFSRRPYGGWSDVVGEQYTGTTQLLGIGVDKNTFRREFVEDNMADEALRRVVALFLDAAEYANLGRPLPDSLKGQLRWLLG